MPILFIAVDDPAYLGSHDFWQVRLIYEIKPENMQFSPGEDGDEVAFMQPATFRNSDSTAERRIDTYANITC